MPNNLETRVKGIAHFSWSWTENYGLMCVESKRTGACCHNYCRVYPTDAKCCCCNRRCLTQAGRVRRTTVRGPKFEVFGTSGNRDSPSGYLAVWESARELVVVSDSESGSDRFLSGASCLNRPGKNYCGTVEIQWPAHRGQQEHATQDAQKGRPARPQRAKR